jgi:gluconokinase
VNYFLGIDIGTTHTKAAVITGDGKPFFEIKKGYDLLHPQPGYEEQDVREIMEAVSTVISQAIGSIPAKENIAAVCFSAAMHSILAVDENDQPISHAIIWADTRSQKEALEISNHPEASSVYTETGVPIHPMSPLCKIAWFRKQQPAVFERAAKFISIKEYVFFRLFGKYLVDHSIAAATGLFSIHEKKWSKKALAMAGIDESKLSELVSTLHTETELTSNHASIFGLKHPVPFVIGSSDGCLANFGSGMVNHGDTAVTIGTSGAARMSVHFPGGPPSNVFGPEKLFTYPLADDVYVRGGAINNGGIVLNWLGELFFDSVDSNIEELLSMAESVGPGANGLLFLPYLLGDRAPIWDAAARGSLIGLTLAHKKQHLVRASIEGVCFSLNHIIRNLETAFGSIGEIYVSGGFVHSAFWVQLLADITGKRILVAEMADASAIGAAYLGMYQTGFLKKLSDVKRFTVVSNTYEPGEENHQVYEKIFQIYVSMYPKLKNDFAALGSI